MVAIVVTSHAIRGNGGVSAIGQTTSSAGFAPCVAAVAVA
jgi:hypothetical protein